MDARRWWVAVMTLALAACGRGGLTIAGDAGSQDSASGSSVGGQSGVGGQGSGAGAPGSGAGGPGSGAGGPGSGAGGPGTGGSEMVCPSLGDVCTGCIAQDCAASWCSCADNPDCLALFSCFGDCQGDEACEQNCLVLHEDGISDVLLVSGCAGTDCNPPCTWGNDQFTDCQECLYSDCASETNACIVAPACSALWQCLIACPQLDLSCQQGCYDAFGEGVPTLQALLQCSTNLCEMDCQ